MQLSFSRNNQFVADGYISAQLRVVDVANANDVTTLLNGRVGLYLFHLFLTVASQPVSRLNVSGHLHLVGASGPYLNASGTGAHVQIYRARHL